MNSKEKTATERTVVDIFRTNRKYGIIYTDPPWPQRKGNLRTCRPAQERALDYKTMGMDEIEQLHREFLRIHTDDRHNVFMWAIDKFLAQTEQMMERLGYTLHARLIWDKQNGVAPAFTVRYSHEYLLWFYRKGRMLMPCKDRRGAYTTVLREASTTHSTKPQAAYEMIESMFPAAPKIELFARHQRKGWDCWGDEVT